MGWLVLPLLPFVLVFWVAVLIFAWTQAGTLRANRPAIGCWGASFWDCRWPSSSRRLGSIPPGGILWRWRAPLALFAAQFMLELPFRAGCALGSGGADCFPRVGQPGCALHNPPGFTTHFDQKTVVDHHYDGRADRFLASKGRTRGYTNYWVSFPLAFLTREEIIYDARLPYHRFTLYPADSRIRAIQKRWMPASVWLISSGEIPCWKSDW